MNVPRRAREHVKTLSEKLLYIYKSFELKYSVLFMWTVFKVIFYFDSTMSFTLIKWKRVTRMFYKINYFSSEVILVIGNKFS